MFYYAETEKEKMNARSKLSEFMLRMEKKNNNRK